MAPNTDPVSEECHKVDVSTFSPMDETASSPGEHIREDVPTGRIFLHNSVIVRLYKVRFEGAALESDRYIKGRIQIESPDCFTIDGIFCGLLSADKATGLWSTRLPDILDEYLREDNVPLPYGLSSVGKELLMSLSNESRELVMEVTKKTQELQERTARNDEHKPQ